MTRQEYFDHFGEEPWNDGPPCEACEGRGTVYHLFLNEDGEDDEVEIDCLACDGTGNT